MTKQRALPWVILIVLSLIWGTSFILIKKGLEVYSPGEVGAIRILAAALFLLPVAIMKLKKLSQKHLKLLLGIGLLGTFIPAFLFAFGQTRIDSGITGVMNGLTPVFVLLVGALFFKQKFEKAKIIGVAMALLGTVLLITSGSGINGISYYALLIVLATVCYGTNLNIIKFYLADLHALTITSVSIGLVGPFAAIYLFGFSPFLDTLQNNDGAYFALAYIALLGVMSTAVALVLFNRLVQMTSPIFTSTVTYLIPIVSLTWGIIDGEKLIVGQVLGILTILIGVFITNKKKKTSAAQK